MALTNEERERIREEEWVRLQAREDFSRSRERNLLRERNPWRETRVVAFATVLVVIALLAFGLARSNRSDRARFSNASYSDLQDRR